MKPFGGRNKNEADEQPLGLSAELIRDERGHIIDVYVCCLASSQQRPLPAAVLQALARHPRRRRDVIAASN
ncbi:MAG: hypothetical protein JO247_13215 [Chloroflexi bacterium]|nr:hypothetical protein [Chloroflexota bacterium]